MITISLSHLPILLGCLWLIFVGLSEFVLPIRTIILRKKFDFATAVAETIVGLTFTAVGLIALGIALLNGGIVL